MSLRLIIIIVLTVFFLDRLTKYFIVSNFKLGQSVAIIDNVFYFTYVLNSGAAFGLLRNHAAFLIIVTILFFCGIIYFFIKVPVECKYLRLGGALLVGGAIGNLIDRIQTGRVVDFLDFLIWPVFNIADIAIVCGVGYIIYSILFYKSGMAVDEEA